ncbi:hypothetical protein HY991_04620 [Candidatus Micrarchaeota archaeon]|nr:hypothetical protein [Candidatus Micrarchaeota archaeon]
MPLVFAQQGYEPQQSGFKMGPPPGLMPAPVGMPPMMPKDIPVEEMVMGRLGEMVFSKFDPDEIEKLCPDEEKVVSTIFSYLSDMKLEVLCEPISEGLESCVKAKEMCGSIKSGEGFGEAPMVDTGDEESPRASCPPDKNVLIEYCKKRFTKEYKEKIKEFDEEASTRCELQWEMEKTHLLRDCEKMKEWSQRTEPYQRMPEQRSYEPMKCPSVASQPREWYDDCYRRGGRVESGTDNQGCPKPPLCVTPQEPAPASPPPATTTPPPEGVPSPTPFETTTSIEQTTITQPVPTTTQEATTTTEQPPTLPPEVTQTTASEASTQEAPVSGFAVIAKGLGDLVAPLLQIATGSPSVAPQPAGGGFGGGQAPAQGKSDGSRSMGEPRGPFGLSLTDSCDQTKFTAKCVEESKKQFKEGMSGRNMDRICELEVKLNIKHFERFCKEKDKAYDMCVKRTGEGCSFIEKQLSKCKEKTTPNEIKAAIRKKARYFCMFSSYSKKKEERKDADPEIFRVASKLYSENTELDEDYRPWVDYESSNLVEVSTDVKEATKDKGVGYKIQHVLGLAAEQERKNAAQLEEQTQKLDKTIERLESLKEQLDDEDAKVTLEEQIKQLKERKEGLSKMVVSMKKNAGGIVDMIKNFLGLS